MMRHTRRWRRQTPPSVTVLTKPNTAYVLQIKRSLRLQRPKGQDAQGPRGKSHLHDKLTRASSLVIQSEEMAAFFRIFDDDLIQDFLWMDCCYKVSDKYLLAMTFVYFKRAHFSISEHNRKNFFIALYLANTMEEDEEETKYDIFPWALGKGWRKTFPRFLKQRDQLWARIQYRAAVSRRCCEEVMAVMPSHFSWQRKRAEHHGGARRHYGEIIVAPRGRSASPAPCALCKHKLGQRLSLPSSGSGSSTGLNSPLTLDLSPEATPSIRKSRRLRGKGQAPQCQRHTVPRADSGCQYSPDASMDWIDEE